MSDRWQALAQLPCPTCGPGKPDTRSTCAGCNGKRLKFPELTAPWSPAVGRILAPDFQAAGEQALGRWGYWSYDHCPSDTEPHQYDVPTREGPRHVVCAPTRQEALLLSLEAL